MQENDSNVWHYEERDGNFVRVEGPASNDEATMEEVEDILLSVEEASPNLIAQSKGRKAIIAATLSLLLAVSLALGIHGSKQGEESSAVTIEQSDENDHTQGGALNRYVFDAIAEANLLPQMKIEYGFSSLIDAYEPFGTLEYQPSKKATLGTIFHLNEEHQPIIIESPQLNDLDFDQVIVEIVDSKEDGQANVVYANFSEIVTKAVRLDPYLSNKIEAVYERNQMQNQTSEFEAVVPVSKEAQLLYDSYREVALQSTFYLATDKTRDLKYDIVRNYFSKSIVSEDPTEQLIAHVAIKDGLQDMRANVLEETKPVFPESEDQSDVYTFYRNQTAQYPTSVDAVFDRLAKDIESGAVENKELAMKGIADGYQINLEVMVAITDIKDKLSELDVAQNVSFDDTALREREIPSYETVKYGFASNGNGNSLGKGASSALKRSNFQGATTTSHGQAKKVR